MPKIYIKNSKLHGKGLFVNKDIKKGEIIFIIKGKKINFLINNKAQAQKAGFNWFGYDKNTWIDVHDSFCDYFNHSCNANTAIKGHVTIVALKDLKKDTEITFDYSLNEADIFWDIKCNCGSGNCRREVRSIQFLPNETYNKNKDHIPKYFKKVYENFSASLFKTDIELRNKWVNFITSN